MGRSGFQRSARGKGEVRQGQWPNLFVVGASKAGTTSLWRYLNHHPGIFMSAEKEPSFFSRRQSLYSEAEAESYLALFAGARGERLRGEASPSYLSRKRAPAAIRRANPDARILISLREPVARTHSAYLSLVSDGIERRTFAEAVGDDLAGRRASGCPTYVKPRLYAPGVARYLEAFEGQLLVLFFEELVADPARVMAQLYRFLDVDPSFADQLPRKPHNQFRQPRNRLIGRLLAARRIARAIVPGPLQGRIAQATMKPVAKPRPDPDSVQRLCEIYEPDVAAVWRLLGRRLPAAWERRFPSCAGAPLPGSGDDGAVGAQRRSARVVTTAS